MIRNWRFLNLQFPIFNAQNDQFLEILKPLLTKNYIVSSSFQNPFHFFWKFSIINWNLHVQERPVLNSNYVQSDQFLEMEPLLSNNYI